MSAKRKGSVRTSPSKDEAPEITESWIADANGRSARKASSQDPKARCLTFVGADREG
jgi:hypothetical protein